MNKKNSITARILAAVALLGAVAVVLYVVDSETGGDGSVDQRNTPRKTANGNGGTTGETSKQAPKAKVYVVEEGDSLTLIAQKTGVSVTRIEKLNPDVDPQALIPGQKLTLR